MRLEAALSGNLEQLMKDELAKAETAVTSGVREATDDLKSALQRQVTEAGLGQRLANTWRGKVYPSSGTSLGAAGFVWTKAPQIMRTFAEGALIKSKDGFWLAVPTPAAPKRLMGKRVTPELYERATGNRLRFIYRAHGPSLLVAENQRARAGKRGGFTSASAKAVASGKGLASVPMFFLFPQVRIRKRFDIKREEVRQLLRLPRLIARKMEGE